MLENQIPVPPLDMVIPPDYGLMLGANFVVLALVMVWIIKAARRTNVWPVVRCPDRSNRARRRK